MSEESIAVGDLDAQRAERLAMLERLKAGRRPDHPESWVPYVNRYLQAAGFSGGHADRVRVQAPQQPRPTPPRAPQQPRQQPERAEPQDAPTLSSDEL